MSAPRLVRLDPPKDLEFDLKCREPVEQKLTITNVTSGPISFKVKTTAPKAYLVRPSNDMLKAGASIEVKILLQPNVERDTPHRFLVQAVQLQKEENLSKQEWSTLSKDQIHEQRLGVVEPRNFGGVSAGQLNELMTVSNSDNVGEMQQKYQELVKYVLTLEQETQRLENERDGLREQARSAGVDGGYSFIWVVLAVIVAVVLSKAAKFVA